MLQGLMIGLGIGVGAGAVLGGLTLVAAKIEAAKRDKLLKKQDAEIAAKFAELNRVLGEALAQTPPSSDLS